MQRTNASEEINSEFSAFAANLEAAASFTDLRTICVQYFERLGVRMMSYHHLPPVGAADYDPHIAVAAHGFPEDWVQLYVSKELYRVDPIPKRALADTRPFLWSEMRSMPGVSAAEMQYLDLLENSGIGDGLAVPVFGPFGRNGYVGFGFGGGNANVDSNRKLLLQLAAQLGHQAYCHMLYADAPRGIRLSQREREILEWVSRGKSNAVIAQILSISPYTVDTHLRRIYQKMGVSDRVTAALRGMALGFLSR